MERTDQCTTTHFKSELFAILDMLFALMFILCMHKSVVNHITNVTVQPEITFLVFH
jgi:hypothetical protein